MYGTLEHFDSEEQTQYMSLSGTQEAVGSGVGDGIEHDEEKDTDEKYGIFRNATDEIVGSEYRTQEGKPENLMSNFATVPGLQFHEGLD